MSGIGLVITGRAVFIVGVEPAWGGGVRVYVSHRSRELFFVVRDPAAIEQVRRAWAASVTGHLVMDVAEVPPVYTSAIRRTVRLA